MQTTSTLIARMTPEPLKPLVTPLRVTEQRFGRVPRAYIECLQDRTVTLGRPAPHAGGACPATRC